MKAIIFGATGMVGQGVLRECLLDPEVERVLVVGRSPVEQKAPKLTEIIHNNFLDFTSIEDRFAGFDACFFCLGVSSAGMPEKEYKRVTYDFTMAAARSLARQLNMTFIYVSGLGTDSSEQGRTMWARVKGKTENDLLKMPFKAAYMFRPAYIQPMHGIKSKTKLYRITYAVMAPLFPLWKLFFPSQVTTTENVGKAMIKAARDGAAKPVLDNTDINRLAIS
ncbi:MAG: NAD(P)H-binding protein [Syntrophomonadaceae bacterium]